MGVDDELVERLAEASLLDAERYVQAHVVGDVFLDSLELSECGDEQATPDGLGSGDLDELLGSISDPCRSVAQG